LHRTGLRFPGKGAKGYLVGAPPNLFNAIICITSLKFWKISTNDWTKEVWRCT
jgi:hypothetical protein